MAILGIYHVNVNCSDLDKSLEFYSHFGFKPMMNLCNPKPHPAQEALFEALGLARDSYCDGYMLFSGDDTHRCRIDLLKFRDHEGYEAKPAPEHAMCLGLQRINIHTDDFEAEVARLHEEGIDPIYPVCNVPYIFDARNQIACYRDPDGTLLELCGADTSNEASFGYLYRLPKEKK